MKIAHVIGSCAPGGAEVFVKSLIKQLKALGNDVELWVMTSTEELKSPSNNRVEFEKSYIKELENANIPVRFIGKRPKKDWIKTSRNLRKLFYDYKPDIVHSHLESATFHVCRSLYKKAIIIQTIHNTKIHHKFIQKNFFGRRNNKIVAISRKVQSILEDNFKIPSERINLIYNGIDTKLFSCGNRNTERKVQKIVSIGRLTEQKDFPNLIKAYQLLKTKLNNESLIVPKLLIVGDGPLKKQLKELVQGIDLTENVEFLGIRNDIPEILRKSDIYVMSSEWEGLSISLIEALVSGIPIVATNAGSNNEIVENNISGLIVPTKNSEALAEGLYRLIINNDLRKKLSKKAQKRAELFSIEKCAKKHLEMYKELSGYSK